MAFDEQLADRVPDRVGPIAGVTGLKMFGGWGVTVHGNMAVGVTDRDLIVRVDRDGFDDALNRPGARPFDFTGRPLTGWVFVDGESVANARALNKVGRSRNQVRGKPAAQVWDGAP